MHNLRALGEWCRPNDIVESIIDGIFGMRYLDDVRSIVLFAVERTIGTAFGDAHFFIYFHFLSSFSCLFVPFPSEQLYYNIILIKIKY